MRSDVILYVVAAFFFALAIVSTVKLTGTDRLIWMALDIGLGIILLIGGYHQRPKTKKTVKTLSNTPVVTPPSETTTQLTPVEETQLESSEVKKSETEEAPVEEAPVETSQTIGASVEASESIVEAPVSSTLQEQISSVTIQDNETPAQVEQEGLPLTDIKGVGEKRAAQLNALGITTAEELSLASVEDLAKGLKISPKVAAKLVEAAKQ